MSFQIQDSKGWIIPGVGHASQSKYITTNTTTEVFTGRGVLLRIIITDDVDGGTFKVQDADAVEAFSGVTDFAGSFNIGEYFENGVSIVTASFTGGKMRVVCMPLP